MFGIDPTILAIVLLAAVSTGAIAYGVLYSRIETDKKTANRINRVRSAETDTAQMKAARDRVQEISKRRKSVQDSLKELEKKQQQEKTKKANAASIKAKLVQSGLSVSLSQFYVLSGILGIVVLAMTFLAGMPTLVIVGAAFVAGLGLPRWIVGFLVSRRQKKFLEEFPNSLDVMVRSIRSGLPLNDAIRMIAADGQEPVKTEFRRIVESQQLGLSVADSVARMHQTMPLSEVSFFAIVIAIQGQAGGNLSEALANLSRVLRDRKKMKAKVNALSMEAKASAAIIGALPFIVAFLVYITSPGYIMILFTDSRGHLILGISAVWMSIGLLVMRNMINFEI
ncbi:MAG: type II secretion system F family protein [Agrobacterium albertimagni]|uniref:Pilus assembly protein n=1 Tax=Agrobacterium albertimagni AOL15 TaxID=1156935 RepID=K2Q9M4_9HYPH|nr:type II secretion system F family protein [Agrobacterium albertimagni]EKF60599.1 pilus assembly protein [Agrobacterium albertimagni AOL15]